MLFIDEAAQMSLANVLAVSQAAQSIVLLGDPRQLEQPMQGSHPEGIDVSALDHILGRPCDHSAGPRSVPRRDVAAASVICAFTSELFYEGRLQSRPGLGAARRSSRTADSTARVCATLPVEHEGNQSSSPEEADAIRDLVAEILAVRHDLDRSRGQSRRRSRSTTS